MALEAEDVGAYHWSTVRPLRSAVWNTDGRDFVNTDDVSVLFSHERALRAAMGYVIIVPSIFFLRVVFSHSVTARASSSVAAAERIRIR
jgi:hypothetical protein